MLAHVDEARSVALRQRLGRSPAMLADEAVPDGGADAGGTEATPSGMAMADYYPAAGEGKRWVGPLLLGGAVGVGLTVIGCMAMGGKKK